MIFKKILLRGLLIGHIVIVLWMVLIASSSLLDPCDDTALCDMTLGTSRWMVFQRFLDLFHHFSDRATGWLYGISGGLWGNGISSVVFRYLLILLISVLSVFVFEKIFRKKKKT